MAVTRTTRGLFGRLRLSDRDVEYVISGIVTLLRQYAKAKELNLWRGAPGSQEADFGGWGNSHAIWALADLLDKGQLGRAFAAIAADATDEATAGARIAIVQRGVENKVAIKQPSEIGMAELLETWLQVVDVDVFTPETTYNECTWGWQVADPKCWRHYPGGFREDGTPRTNPFLGYAIYELPTAVPMALSRHLPKNLRRALESYQSSTVPDVGPNGLSGPSIRTVLEAEVRLTQFLKDRYPGVNKALFMTSSFRPEPDDEEG